MLNILYIGPNDSEWAQMNRPVSLAGAKWARGFLTALSKFAKVTALCHTYEVAWPRGKVFWRGYDKRLYPKGWDCVSVSYPVLKVVREWWWRFAYSAKAKRIVKEKKMDVVLIYNCYESWQVPVLRAIKATCPGVKIVPIILDGDDPRKDNWQWMKNAARYSDAFVALSWWVYQNIPANTGKSAYHFDGGADGWRGLRDEKWGKRKEKVLVHTGALDQWRGLDFMAKVVDIITRKRDDVKFVFCGKSSEKAIRSKFGDNPKVELRGFVSEAEMGEICNSADVLLNVRDPNHPDNILNYPSKLPHYLSFGRPIISTRLASLSPEYEDVVHYPKNDTVEAYVEKIEEVLGMDSVAKRNEYDMINKWFISHKTWDLIVKDLISWLETIT